MAFNNSVGLAGISLFYANYGYHPRMDRDSKEGRPIAEGARVSAEKMTELHKMLKEELDRISKKTTITANKKRSEGPDFKEGEMVYVNMKNVKTQRPSKKLDHTKIGPYKILKKLGPVTFELQIPEGMNIHTVFHKNLLEPAPPNAKPGPVLIDTETQEPLYDVEEIRGYDPKTKKYLIKWLGYEEEDNTWELQTNINPRLIAQYHHQKEAGNGPSAGGQARK